MYKYYNLNNFIKVSLSGEDDDFFRYMRKELDGFVEFNDSDFSENKLQTISISAERVAGLSSNILSLGKGIFFDKDFDKILFSIDQNTSLFQEGEIYASITNIYTQHESAVEISVNPKILLKNHSFLRSIYRKLVKLDPHSSMEKAAESFFSQVVEPLLYRCYQACGQVLLHAAAVERDNKVSLILGPQNIGKTSFTVELTRRGWNMLGDDMCLLSSNGLVLSHPKPLKIENEHFKRDAFFYTTIFISKSRVLRILNPLYRWLVKKRGTFEFKASPSELGIALAKQGELQNVFFLQRWTRSSFVDLPSIVTISDLQAARLVGQHVAAEVDVNKRLDRDIRHVLNLHSLGPQSLSLLTDEAQSIIDMALKDKACYILNMHVPDKSAVDVFQEIN